jgi:hypothetical protein
VDVLVIDPVVGDYAAAVAKSASALREFLAAHASVPLVLYASKPAVALSVVVHLHVPQACEVLVDGFDDAPERIAHAIYAAVDSSLVTALVQRIEGAGVTASPAFWQSVRQLLSKPELFNTVDDVARAAFMSRRTFDRYLARRSLATGSDLVRLARVFSAVRAGRNAADLNTLRAACGIGRKDSVDVVVQQVLGSPLCRLLSCTPRDIVDCVADRIFRSNSDNRAEKRESAASA